MILSSRKKKIEQRASELQRTYSPRLHVFHSVIDFVYQRCPIFDFATELHKVVGLFDIVEKHGFEAKTIAGGKR